VRRGAGLDRGVWGVVGVVIVVVVPHGDGGGGGGVIGRGSWKLNAGAVVPRIVTNVTTTPIVRRFDVLYVTIFTIQFLKQASKREREM